MYWHNALTKMELISVMLKLNWNRLTNKDVSVRTLLKLPLIQMQTLKLQNPSKHLQQEPTKPLTLQVLQLIQQL
jgi:hypothetical protein